MTSIPRERDVVYLGCTETGETVLRTLLERDVPVSEVVTVGPERAERAAVSGYRDLGELAHEHDVATYYPESYSLDTDADRAHFRDLSADLMIVNGWQRLVPPAVLETLEFDALGIHGSAFGLPKGRGRSPLNWSLVEGLDRFLLSVIRLAPDADAGGVAATRKFDITAHDDIRTLYYKTAMATEEMLLDVVGPILRGEFEFEAQSGEPTYYPKRNPEDGAINWEATTADVYGLVRAVARPYPGAFTECDGTRVDVWEAIPFSSDLAPETPAGEIVRVFEATGDFVVATADGTLLVTDWEADGWVPEAGASFASLGDHGRVDRPEHRENLTGEGA